MRVIATKVHCSVGVVASSSNWSCIAADESAVGLSRLGPFLALFPAFVPFYPYGIDDGDDDVDDDDDEDGYLIDCDDVGGDEIVIHCGCHRRLGLYSGQLRFLPLFPLA